MSHTTIATTSEAIAALRAAMDRHGLTHQALAELAGMHQPGVTAILSGRKSIRLDTLLRLTRALNLHVRIAPVPPGPGAAG